MNAMGDSVQQWLCVTGLAFLAVVTFGSTAIAAEKFQKLSGAQIRARLAGMEFTDNVPGATFISAMEP